MEYKGHWITDKKIRKHSSGEPCYEYQVFESDGERTTKIPASDIIMLHNEIDEVERMYWEEGDESPTTYFKVKQTYDRVAGCYTLKYIPCYSRLETDEERDARVAKDKEYWDKYDEEKLKKLAVEKEKEREAEQQKIEEAKSLLERNGYTVSK